MMTCCVKLAILLVLTMSFAVARLAWSQSSAPSSQGQAQSQQAEKPPHVDAEPTPSDRDLERTIHEALKQDPHMAYSRIRVHVTGTEVVLSGVVLTETAKNQAAQIAADHAAGRKVNNMLKVNPNIHPGPGI